MLNYIKTEMTKRTKIASRARGRETKNNQFFHWPIDKLPYTNMHHFFERSKKTHSQHMRQTKRSKYDSICFCCSHEWRVLTTTPLPLRYRPRRRCVRHCHCHAELQSPVCYCFRSVLFYFSSIDEVKRKAFHTNTHAYTRTEHERVNTSKRNAYNHSIFIDPLKATVAQYIYEHYGYKYACHIYIYMQREQVNKHSESTINREREK